MTFESTRLHNTWFQEIRFLKISKIMLEMLTRAHMCTRNSKPGVDTVVVYEKSLQSLSIILNLEAIWVMRSGCPRVSPLLIEDASISEMCALEASASHHKPTSTWQEMVKAIDHVSANTNAADVKQPQLLQTKWPHHAKGRQAMMYRTLHQQRLWFHFLAFGRA